MYKETKTQLNDLFNVTHLNDRVGAKIQATLLLVLSIKLYGVSFVVRFVPNIPFELCRVEVLESKIYIYSKLHRC